MSDESRERQPDRDRGDEAIHNAEYRGAGTPEREITPQGDGTGREGVRDEAFRNDLAESLERAREEERGEVF